MVSPFDISKHLTEKTPLEFDMKEYSPFVVNKVISNTMDTLFFAEAMNKFRDLDKDIQKDFYYYGIPKGKRFGKWHKADINKDVELVMKAFKLNKTIAEQYISVMSSDDIEQLKERMCEGGRK